jgi:hypothetical protein
MGGPGSGRKKGGSIKKKMATKWANKAAKEGKYHKETYNNRLEKSKGK